ncbi:hypothetical protein OHD28_14685 [Escherichia coli]|nr:hypothetical protein [Escherichia coli]
MEVNDSWNILSLRGMLLAVLLILVLHSNGHKSPHQWLMRQLLFLLSFLFRIFSDAGEQAVRRMLPQGRGW